MVLLIFSLLTKCCCASLTTFFIATWKFCWQKHATTNITGSPLLNLGMSTTQDTLDIVEVSTQDELDIVEALLFNNKIDVVYSVPRDSLRQYEDVVVRALRGPNFLTDDSANIVQLIQQGNKEVSVIVFLIDEHKLRVTSHNTSSPDKLEPELVRLQVNSEGENIVFKLNVDLGPLCDCKCQGHKCASGGESRKFKGVREQLVGLLNKLAEQAVFLIPSSEPNMEEETDDLDRDATIFVFKARVGGGAEQSWVNHWALGVNFGDCWVTLEGLNYKLVLSASYLKSSTPPAGTKFTIEESNKKSVLRSLRMENILNIKTSPQKLRTIAKKNPLNGVKYELIDFSCQNWVVETVKMIGQEAKI